jgi:diguanylate cyclase (GGDEF)-like protein
MSSKANIVVVADDERIRTSVVESLRPLRQNVFAAKTFAGLDLAADDCAMAVVSEGTAGQLRGWKRPGGVPVLILTEDGSSLRRLRALLTDGIVDFLPKPHRPEYLRARARIFIHLHQLKAAVSTMSHQALHDPLTKLPNRTLFFDRVRMSQARMRRRRCPAAVLFVDLDDFKAVNDTQGHKAGDGVLTEVGQRLQRVVRPSDTVARLGGDEFTVLCEDVASDAGIAEIAARVEAAIREPVVFEGKEICVTGSVGALLLSNPDATPEDVVNQVDAAMYGAKRDGGSDWRIARPQLRRGRADAASESRDELVEALARGEFRLYFQPQICLETGEMIGTEALLRWHHPQRGLVPPDEFIPRAEAEGSIVAIGAWALRQACDQARTWSDRGSSAAAWTMSVNISPRQLVDPGLVDLVAECSEGVDLTLEITEGVLTENVALARKTLEELKRLGVTIAIDDFGTGYAAIRSLRQFPVDALKVDRSFVEELGSNEQSAAVAHAIVALAHGLGLQAAAEGVESREQLAEVRKLGFDTAQGFLFARPSDASVVEDWFGVARIHEARTTPRLTSDHLTTARPAVVA